VKKVLVVDDDALIVEIILDVLSELDVTVLCAYDGEQALQLVQDQAPDLVISDLVLPRLDGWQLCQRLRASPKTRDVRFVAMSAIHRPKSVDCNAFLPKPFDIDDLLATVERLV